MCCGILISLAIPDENALRRLKRIVSHDCFDDFSFLIRAASHDIKKLIEIVAGGRLPNHCFRCASHDGGEIVCVNRTDELQRTLYELHIGTHFFIELIEPGKSHIETVFGDWGSSEFLVNDPDDPVSRLPHMLEDQSMNIFLRKRVFSQCVTVRAEFVVHRVHDDPVEIE